MENKFKNFIEKIKDAKKIIVMGHKNPDGDSIASTLALSRLIELNFQKKVVSIYDGNIPDCLDFLPDRDKIHYFQHIDKNEKYDVAVLLDYGIENQIGGGINFFKQADCSFEIDHHKHDNNTVADIVLNDDKASATGVIVYRLMKELGLKFDKEILELIAVSIITDTGFFKYAKNPEVFEIMAWLVEQGVVIEDLIEGLANKPRKTVQVEAAAAASAEFYYKNKLALAVIDSKSYKNLDGRGELCLNLLGQIKGVEYIVLLKEQKENQIGVSLRGKNKPINHIAVALGGGGHMYAAGAVVHDSLENVQKKVLDLFKGI